MKVVHVGSYPPPYGGISSHIKRLDLFCRQRGIASVVVDSNGSNCKVIPPEVKVIQLHGHRIEKLYRLIWYLMSAKADIVHFHLSVLSNFLWGAVPLSLAIKHSKRLISLHSGSFVYYYESLPRPLRLYTCSVFKQFDHLIVVNPDQRNYLVSQMGIEPQHISVIPAFLPPISNSIDNRRELLPQSLLDFCGRFTCTALIIGSANPRYGFHTSIQALDLLKDLPIGLIIHFYRTMDKEYKLQICKMAKTHKNVYISNTDMNEEQIAVLLNIIRIFIRGTSVDGDSVALREAAYFKRQIVATDSVRRPEGCLLYPFGDQDALAQRLREAASDTTVGVVREPGFRSGERVLGLYRTMISR